MPGRQDLTDRAVVIEARDVHKSFRVPEHRLDSFKERLTRPFTRAEYRELKGVQGLSFDVREGEFFGIVGRNGSGKSTLLKLIASIYGADSGSIRIAGRVAPFIELGVGFNMELTARENVVLNGVMMGLTRRQATARTDDVLDFAELREFTELKLKNYSSGMLVRLAFAVMVQADADVMLIDEILAVGDAAFAQKCMDVFAQRRAAGRTIVLVTHDMATVEGICDRAMLMHEGRMVFAGDPSEAALRYFRLNFAGEGAAPLAGSPSGALPDVHVRMVSAALTSAGGAPMANVEQGEQFGIDLLLEARTDLREPTFGLQVVDGEGTVVFGFRPPYGNGDGGPDEIPAGERVRIRGTIDNPLMPGRYVLNCFVRREDRGGGAIQMLRPLEFVVFGTAQPGHGVVSVRAAVTARQERPR